MNVNLWANRIIRWGFYLLFILVPLILTPWNFELFEYNKMMATYALTAVILGAWLVKMVDVREFRVAKTPLDIPILLFVISQLVSTLFSIDPHVSWFGYYSRFNGGMFSVISYTALYYAFVTNFAHIFPVQKKADIISPIIFRITRLVKVILTTAAVISIYGVLEHFGIDKNLWVQDVQSRVFSTLGQPNWLAAYIIALVPVAMAIALTGKKLTSLNTIIWGATTLLFFIVTLFTRSRSGYIGLAAADVIFWAILLFTSKNKISLRAPFILIHALLLVIVFFNGVYVSQIDSWVTLRGWRDRFTHKTVTAPAPQLTPSGTALESGGTESGTIRKYVWQGAVNAWRATTKNMLVGTGTETFAFAFYKYRPVGHNLTSEWDFLYNKAHNEFLNYLATTGIFGLGSYLFLIGAFIFWFVSRVKHHVSVKGESHDVSTLEIALFAGWGSILVTNFFGFSVVVMQLFLFLFPAIIITLARAAHEKDQDRVYPLKLSTAVTRNGVFVIAGVTISLLVVLYRYWKADTFYALGNRLGRSGQNAQAQSYDTQAIALNPGEPVYHDDLSSTLAALSLSAAQEKNATLAADLAKRSLAQSTIAITTSPQNVNFWKTRTKIYYTFSSFDSTLTAAAIDALEKAAALSPNDPKIYYNLAILYGRDGNNDKALELLNKSKTLKPNYRDAYFGLYVFYTELKQPDAAKKELQDYLNTVDPNDRDFTERLKQI